MEIPTGKMTKKSVWISTLHNPQTAFIKMRLHETTLTTTYDRKKSTMTLHDE